MPATPDPLAPLRAALEVSPDNLPLRQHLAESLAGLGRYAEAEQEYRHALGIAPDNVTLKVGLARTYFRQGKDGPAAVIVEDLLKKPDTPADVYLLHARLLYRAGDVERAVRQYRAAVDADPGVADPDFAGLLGVGADLDEGEVVEGRVRAAAGPDVGGGPAVPIERPGITFADVGGLDALKDEIRLK